MWKAITGFKDLLWEFLQNGNKMPSCGKNKEGQDLRNLSLFL
jgi:hypothetical protein